MDNLVEKVRKTLLAFRMVSPGDKILVAVSGGTDSVTLLHLLHGLADEFKLQLHVAHLNHLARGNESDEDSRFVSRLGEKLGLETFIESIDVKKERANFKTSFQETGRILRYRFLERTLQKTGGNKIAMGHTADDQVETVLMNLLRGSGLKGLAGIPPVRGNIVRPLIECFRAELDTYLKEQGLEFRTDPSNANQQYLRNRIRLDLIPKLQAEYNKNIKTRILDTAGIIRDEEDFLSAHLQKCFEECSTEKEEGREISLNLQKLRRQNPALQKRLIRKAIFHVKGDLRRVSAKHVQGVVELAAKPRPHKEIHLPGPLLVVCNREKLVFKRNLKGRFGIQVKGLPSAVIELKIPGITRITEISLKFIVKLLSPGHQDYAAAFPNQAFFDFDKAGEAIRTRFFLPGDRFVPLGMTGKKKLKSFFIDEKVPREQRNKIPILTTRDNDIIWVFGKRISNTYRVTAETRKILFIEGIPAG